jgi:hypothetical protein
MSLPSDLDKEKLSQAALAILGLTADGDHQVVRVWKGMDWDLLDVLFEKGWISDPKGKAKSVVLSDEGARLAEEFLTKHFGKRARRRGSRVVSRRVGRGRHGTPAAGAPCRTGDVRVRGGCTGSSLHVSRRRRESRHRGVLSNRARSALLYAEHLTDGFFNLSSGEAGAVLQKLRNYGVRLALVCPAGSAQFSSRFGEMVAEEQLRNHFGVFETRQAAREWLARR